MKPISSILPSAVVVSVAIETTAKPALGKLHAKRLLKVWQL